MANNQNAFPKLDSPLVDPAGKVTIPWYKFLIALWNRTGGASGSPSAVLDGIGSAQGDVLFRGAAEWQVLPPTTAGYALKTEGVGANPIWGSVVSEVLTGTGLTGGPILTTGTVSIAANGVTNSLLAQAPAQTLKGNNALVIGNVSDLTAAQVKGILNYIASGDAAGGNLTGTYPNPTIPGFTPGLGLPNFQAILSAGQAVTSGVLTKCQFDTVVFDSGAYYDHTTNFRYTPLVAGTYQVDVTILGVGAGISEVATYIYKNGSGICQAEIDGVTNNSTSKASMLVKMNGTTDYLEGWGRVTATSGATFGSNGAAGTYITYFEAYRIGP